MKHKHHSNRPSGIILGLLLISVMFVGFLVTSGVLNKDKVSAHAPSTLPVNNGDGFTDGFNYGSNGGYGGGGGGGATPSPTVNPIDDIAIDLQNPATWHFLTGGDNNLSPEVNVQHAVSSGANGIYSPCIFIDAWENDAKVGYNYPDYTQADWAKQYCQELHNAGIAVDLQGTFWAFFSGFDGKSTEQWYEDIIRNVGGAQDTYINQYKHVILDVQPDIVQIMNEPIGSAEWGTTNYMTEYEDFINRAMSEFNSVKPGLTYVVMAVPFWDLTQINNIDFVVPSGCTLVESFHYYYDWNGMGYSDLYIDGNPFYAASIAYWNNKNGWADNSGSPLSPQERSTAFDITIHEVLVHEGVQDAWDKGRLVFWEESGGCLTNPNMYDYLEDTWGWAIQNNLGFVALDELVPYDQTQPAWSRYPGAIFNEDWSYNAIGQAWALYV